MAQTLVFIRRFMGRFVRILYKHLTTSPWARLNIGPPMVTNYLGGTVSIGHMKVLNSVITFTKARLNLN